MKINYSEKDVARFWSKVSLEPHPRGCWLWTGGLFKTGYGGLWWEKKVLKAHRISYLLAYGEYDDALEVCHTCDNPACVNHRHLFLGTHQDNMDDMTKKGRNNPLRGENVHTAKITWLQRDEIIRIYATGERTQESIGLQFGLHGSQISRIVRGVFWKDDKPDDRLPFAARS